MLALGEIHRQSQTRLVTPRHASSRLVTPRHASSRPPPAPLVKTYAPLEVLGSHPENSESLDRWGFPVISEDITR